MRKRTTLWLPVMWQTEYRGQTLWVEQEYAKGLRWSWHAAGKAGDADGRAASKVLGQRAACAAVDALLGGSPRPRSRR